MAGVTESAHCPPFRGGHCGAIIIIIAHSNEIPMGGLLLMLYQVPTEQSGRPVLPWGTATNIASSWLLHWCREP